MRDGDHRATDADGDVQPCVERPSSPSSSSPSAWATEDDAIRAWVDEQERGAPPDRLSRLLGDVQVLTRLLDSDFADDDWLPAAEEFARYGVGVLSAWIGTGAIFGKVKARTSYSLESPPNGWLDEDAVHDLSADTVVDALQSFRDDVLRKRRWDPRKGASMKTFFIGQCLFRFPNVYRGWLRERRRHLAVAPSDQLVQLERGLGVLPAADASALHQASMVELLSLLSVKAARRAALLQAAGYTQEEIAADLGLPDAKAVENLLGHQRRRLQRQTASGHHGRGAS